MKTGATATASRCMRHRHQCNETRLVVKNKRSPIFFLVGALFLLAGHHLRLTRGPAGNRTTASNLSATRIRTYQLSHEDTHKKNKRSPKLSRCVSPCPQNFNIGCCANEKPLRLIAHRRVRFFTFLYQHWYWGQGGSLLNPIQASESIVILETNECTSSVPA